MRKLIAETGPPHDRWRLWGTESGTVWNLTRFRHRGIGRHSLWIYDYGCHGIHFSHDRVQQRYPHIHAWMLSILRQPGAPAMTDDTVPADVRAVLMSTLEADPSLPPVDWNTVPLDVCIEIARLRTALAVANGRIEALQARQRLGEEGDTAQPLVGPGRG
jgi:hypothetical protein